MELRLSFLIISKATFYLWMLKILKTSYSVSSTWFDYIVKPFPSTTIDHVRAIVY